MRIRSIKPEFWRSDDIDALSWDDRLVFIGLWSYVDDNGVGKDKLASIAADLFAGDLSVEPTETLRRLSLALDALCKRDMIRRYEVDGKPYLYISQWDKHQLVKNPNKPRYPLPTCDYSVPPETLRRTSVEPPETLPTGTEEQGNRGTEEEVKKPSRVAPLADLDEDPDFVAFWSAYPRRTDKGHARQAWKRALRKKVEPATLIGAAKSFAITQQGKQPEFIPHPSTWLNGERWNDEQPKPQADPNAWMRRR